jgi:hypothetical protein
MWRRVDSYLLMLVHRSLIFSTLKMKAIRSSETLTKYLHGATSQKTAFFKAQIP